MPYVSTATVLEGPVQTARLCSRSLEGALKLANMPRVFLVVFSFTKSVTVSFYHANKI